eukprot:gb/GECG01015410.1/.p1 GENE.gb/GECG01015410.1/~~gb/GECG01015410.1/.p1  ORF type:complete len:118 (+),score=8.86 gb/GECG01015410.1/:1-354(+)
MTTLLHMQNNTGKHFTAMLLSTRRCVYLLIAGLNEWNHGFSFGFPTGSEIRLVERSLLRYYNDSIRILTKGDDAPENANFRNETKKSLTMSCILTFRLPRAAEHSSIPKKNTWEEAL